MCRPQISLKTSVPPLRAPTPAQARQHRSQSRRHSSMSISKLVVAAVLVIAIGAPIAGLLGEMKEQPMTSTGVRVPFLHGFPTGQLASQTGLASLEHANEWLNSPPLTTSALRGKVVLIDFWTYTCINWLRTLPYVRAWAEKYRDQGLVVIGVHAPEFAFEKDVSNVRWAVKDMRIDYPIAVDSDHVIWRAFRESILAGVVFHRCAGAPSTSSFRRGLIPAVGDDHSRAAGGGRSHRHQS